MYNLSDFVEWDDPEHMTGETPVLAWNLKEGYHFIQYGFVFGDRKIIARKK